VSRSRCLFPCERGSFSDQVKPLFDDDCLPNLYLPITSLPLFRVTPRPLCSHPPHLSPGLLLHTHLTPAPQHKTPAAFVPPSLLCAQTLCGPLDPNKVMGIPIKRDASSRDETGSRTKLVFCTSSKKGIRWASPSTLHRATTLRQVQGST